MSESSIDTIIKKYLGIPYQHGGRDLRGLDCLGLAYFLYKDFGINIPDGDGTPYSNRWPYEDPERYLRGILKIGTAAPLNDLKALDFVYFKIGKFISHGGVMVDSNHFIHSLRRQYIQVSPLDPIWRKRLAGARRFDKLSDQVDR